MRVQHNNLPTTRRPAPANPVNGEVRKAIYPAIPLKKPLKNEIIRTIVQAINKYL